MKNLRIYNGKSVDFGSDVIGHCIDSDNGTLYVITKEFGLLKTLVHSPNAKPEKLDHNLDHHSLGIDNLNRDDVRLVEFVVESGSILIALKSGHLIRIGVSSFSLDSECLYRHKIGISSLRLSPDQDLIALADDENNIYIMSIDCEIIHQANALTQNESLHKPVGVGWGSKETQFFGLDGRPSKEKQQKDIVEFSDEVLAITKQIESSPAVEESRRRQERSTVIDWRGDGQFVGTLTFLPESNKHSLKVWNRNLALQYMSEQLVTIERGLLCWIPNGQYICCAQRRDQGVNEIAMFEKNGMVHQRITLPTIMTDLYIRDMAWSPDSKILAIIANQFFISGDQVQFKPILMLYTMQNFHYYLKFSSNLTNNSDFSLSWDPTHHNRLHTISSSGHYRAYDSCFEVAHSEEYSTVAVVDANKVFITPMELCNIPPPMSAIVIETSSPIYKMALSPSKASNMFILLVDNRLVCISSNTATSPTLKNPLKFHLENHVADKLYEGLRNYQVFHIDDAQSYQHLIPVNEFSLVATKQKENDCEIVSLRFPKGGDSEPVIRTLNTITDNRVVFIARDSAIEPTNLTLMLSNMSVITLDIETGQTKCFLDLNSAIASNRLDYNFIDMQVIKSSSSCETALVSLGQDLSLRFNADIILANSCTSFRITENYLIYTTTDSTMHFILLNHIWKKEAGNTVASWSQPIETGGTLVIACERSSKVVLQMPRGNLEILHPRVLIFSTLTHLLDNQNYIEAIKFARRHRLNMNFLCDYLLRLLASPRDLNQFANDVAHYDPSLLCLFITELDNIDTITGRYEGIMKHLPDRLVQIQSTFESSNPDKVHQISSTIDLPKEQKFLHPRLLCHLKKKEISEALYIVKELDRDSRSEALAFMLYFIDIDQLFSQSLCTYDTDVALMVAGASHKDPKEYLALLDDFNKVDNSNLRSFRIDMHVKRYEEAFRHLLIYSRETGSEESTRLIDLVISKRIYKHALSLLDEQDGHLTEIIWVKYAEYLLEKRYYAEAGLAYSKALDLHATDEYFSSSLKCFLLADDWELSLVLVKKSKVSDSFKQESLRKISKQLMEHGKYREAMIVLQGMKSHETISGLIDRENWHLANILSDDTDLKDKLIESILARIDSLCFNCSYELDLARKNSRG